MENKTDTLTSFLLMGLTFDPEVQLFLFLVFLFMYLVTLLGNAIIMIVTMTDNQLSTPMYFFLRHLAFVDICFSSVTVPKLLANLFTGQEISKPNCFLQMFLLLLIVATEGSVLSAMAYDRYAAICKPLHYIQIMNKTFCQGLMAAAWITGFFYALANTLPILNVVFCGSNIIKHFSCELISLLALSCTETFMNNTVFFISAGLMAVFTFPVILTSYICIISSILKMNSAAAKRKTFSTCSSHLIVVLLFYSTGYFRYLRPNIASSVIVDEIVSIQYSISTPMLNPIIYSLTNREVKGAIKKLMTYKRLSDQTRGSISLPVCGICCQKR